jgi:type II secretory pathway pseudopilin PulG
MNLRLSHSGFKKQQGIATLVTVLVLLIATTITAFTMTSSIVNEKQVVSEERRALSAFEAAQSGLATGIDTFRRTGTLPLIASAATGSISTGATWEYWQEPSGDDIILFAKGYSDDLSVERQVRMLIDFAKLDLPEVSLVTAGVMNVGGNLSITNTQGNLTVWSGQKATFGGSSITITPAPGQSSCTPKNSGKAESGVGCIVASSATTRSSDVVESDPTLSALSENEFQRAFLGETIDYFCDDYIDVDYKTDDQIQTLINNSGSKVCLESGTGSVVSAKVSFGTEDNPKIVVVDDDFKVTSNDSSYGLLYVRGDIEQANGTAVFNGTVVVQGQVNVANGNFKVIFDSSYTDGFGDKDVTTAVAGTWRDW